MAQTVETCTINIGIHVAWKSCNIAFLSSTEQLSCVLKKIQYIPGKHWGNDLMPVWLWFAYLEGCNVICGIRGNRKSLLFFKEAQCIAVLCLWKCSSQGVDHDYVKLHFQRIYSIWAAHVNTAGPNNHALTPSAALTLSPSAVGMSHTALLLPLTAKSLPVLPRKSRLLPLYACISLSACLYVHVSFQMVQEELTCLSWLFLLASWMLGFSCAEPVQLVCIPLQKEHSTLGPKKW